MLHPCHSDKPSFCWCPQQPGLDSQGSTCQWFILRRVWWGTVSSYPEDIFTCWLISVFHRIQGIYQKPLPLTVLLWNLNLISQMPIVTWPTVCRWGRWGFDCNSLNFSARDYLFKCKELDLSLKWGDKMIQSSTVITEVLTSIFGRNNLNLWNNWYRPKEAILCPNLYVFPFFIDCLWLDRLWWKNEEAG